MEKCTIKIGLLVSIVILILIGIIGNASAATGNCPSSIAGPKTTIANAHGYFDSDAGIMSHTLDININKPGSGIIEYCVYPNDPFSGSSGDVTPYYPGWSADHDENDAYFGYDGHGEHDIPLDISDDVDVGEVHYGDHEHTERVYIHIRDHDECSSDGSNNDDCWREVDIEHNKKPIARPGGPYTGTEGIVVTFDGSLSSDPDGSIVSYTWNFGDGNFGTGVSPSHVYTQNGTYTVILLVEDNDGLTSTKTTTATIVDAVVSPIARHGGPYIGTEGTAVVLNGASSSDPDGTIVSYLWNFGDGSTGTDMNPLHTYVQNGIYTVTITVTDNSGATNSSVTTATIADIKPVSIFSASPLSGEEPLTVTFTDSSTTYDGIILWRWDFNNDGTVDSIERNPIHVYSSAGTYGVNLTVCETDGDCSTSGNTITVTPLPIPTVLPTVSPTVSPTPTPGDLISPSKPLCPVAIVVNPTTVNFSWRESTDNVGVVGYKVYRSLDGINYNQVTTVTSLYYVDPGRTTGTTYYYTVIAVDAAGNPSLPSDQVYATPRDINAPVMTVPLSIIAEATSPNGAIVTFLASATDDIDGAIIPTCNYLSGSVFPLGLTTVTCTATDNAGNIGSAIFSITVRDTTPPTSPSGLTGNGISISRIDISWEPSVDAVGTIRYMIYRSLNGIDFALIGTTTLTNFQNYGLMPNTTYYYSIGAVDTAGNPSVNSSIANAKTLEPVVSPPGPTPTAPPGPGPTPTPGPYPILDYPPILTLSSDIILEATSPRGAVATFSPSAYDNEDGNYKVVTCNRLSGSTFPIGITYVTCTAADSVGNIVSGTFAITVRDTISPTAPTGLTATVVSMSRIDLSWTASADVVGVRQYIIYRSQGTFVTIWTTTGTSFQNTGLIPNTTYSYYVIAFDNASNPSDHSDTVSAKTFEQPPSSPPGPTPTGTPGPSDTGTPGPLPTDTPNPCSPVLNTQTGQTIEVSPAPSVGVRFDTVLACGDTTAVAYYDNQWVPLPNNYKPVLFYDITTTSTYSDSITIQVTYSGTPSGINENSIRLFHYENGNWVDVTTGLDTTSNIVTGVVHSLSPFGLGGTGSGGSEGSGSSTVMRGSSFDIIGLMILVVCLATISILILRREEKDKRKK